MFWRGGGVGPELNQSMVPVFGLDCSRVANADDAVAKNINVLKGERWLIDQASSTQKNLSKLRCVVRHVYT